MPPAVSALAQRLGAAYPAGRRDVLRVAVIAFLHVASLTIMALTEDDLVAELCFLLSWGVLNFFWLALTRRPAVSAALSLSIIVLLVLVSRLKFDIIWMTASFLDVMIIDHDTINFLLSIMPGLYRDVIISIALVLPLIVLLWRLDTLPLRRRTSLAGMSACLAGVMVLSMAEPQEDWETFLSGGYVSKFVRSGVTALTELTRHGYMESDAAVTDRLRLLGDATCVPAQKPPHIIMVHDESSFDIRVAPGIKVPPGYGSHFLSFDGKARHFVVEGAGGPSWYTEYNVLAGLSARSFGKFSYYVTRIAAGRVERGLPTALRRCGYRTFSIYPALGAFMSARSFQASTGVQNFYDQRSLGTSRVEPDQFYYDAARRMIAREHEKAPMFLFVYLAQNHYPWDYRWRPDLMPEWKDLGNTPLIDEYLRRQALSDRDYTDLIDHLKRDFPDDSFLLVRYGDHQPDFASFILEPSLDEAGIAQRLSSYDPRYFTTYYAIDAINYQPVNVEEARETIEGPYLPMITQELAGLPLDASFAEQKRIFERCRGQFYACAGGAEARRFNRLLINAGLIKGL
ncbi:MAG TPA: sulfatase-like hydrolase/transferase [Xanthobacteraceae bacterium]|nr:sulfatase-like hydrolase/transferase [Xanthobacteraceae bacterium]